MREAALPVLLAVFIVASATVLAIVVDGAEKRAGVVQVEKGELAPEDTTVKLLLADPEHYSGKRVRIKTKGLELDPSGLELYFRHRTDTKKVIVCMMRRKIEGSVPEYITGVCDKKEDGPVTLSDCQ